MKKINSLEALSCLLCIKKTNVSLSSFSNNSITSILLENELIEIKNEFYSLTRKSESLLKTFEHTLDYMFGNL